MNYKKSKNEVINEAWAAANSSLYSDFYNLKNGLMNNSNNSNLDQIQQAISQGIEAAIRSLVENTYTDQEFEEDLSLR